MTCASRGDKCSTVFYLRVRDKYIQRQNAEYEKTLPHNRRLAPKGKKEELEKMLKNLQTEVRACPLSPARAQPPARWCPRQSTRARIARLTGRDCGRAHSVHTRSILPVALRSTRSKEQLPSVRTTPPPPLQTRSSSDETRSILADECKGRMLPR